MSPVLIVSMGFFSKPSTTGIFFPKNDQPFSFYVDFPSGECRHFTVEANGLAMVDAQMAEILAAKYGCRIEES